MKLITMVEVSGAGEDDEHKIAKLLTVSCCYMKSPKIIKILLICHIYRFHT
jgi:hypothetical protein